MSILSSPNTSLLTTTMLVGAGSFRERDLVSNPSDPWGNAWGSFQARQNRYAFFWAVHENNVYRKVHLYAEGLRQDFDLYPAIRSIFGPGYRCGEFWSEHLMGGRLDPKAGDGSIVPTAIPIKVSDDAGKQHSPGTAGGAAASGDPEPDRASWLRPAIAKLWADSNWQSAKDVWTRFGSVLGDVGLVAHDDARRKKVYLRVIHPRTLQTLSKDPQGNCKGYTLAYMRDDPTDINPLGPARQCLYQEVADRVGDGIRYRTFKDGIPYDWEDYPEDERPAEPVTEWTEPYDFIPLVHVQHRDMGLGWGWSELQADLSKLLELDDIAAKVSDYVRKVVDAPWLMTGVAAEEVVFKYIRGEDETSDEELPRSRTPMMCSANPAAKGQPLIAPLSIGEASAYVMKILTELERDHPEFTADISASSGDASGRALRVAREKLEARVISRRAAYDDAMTRITQMALSIGRVKNYPGYTDIPEDAYAQGLLSFTIGERPVFSLNVMDRIEEQQAKANVDAARAATLASLRQSGVALGTAMRLAGYSDAEAGEAEETALVDQAQRLGMMRQQLQMEAEAKAAAGVPQGTPPGGGGPGGEPPAPKAAGAKSLPSAAERQAANSAAQAA